MELRILGGPNFFPKSGFFRVAQFWILGNGCGLSSCADPKVSAFDSSENTPCSCKTDVLYKKSFFRFGPFSGHAPIWEITISATNWCCKCAPCFQKTNILTYLNFIEMQKTSLVIVKHMFCVATIVFLLEQLL